MSVFDSLFPRQIDNRFDGPRPALWLLGLFVALKLAMSANSILNTASVAVGADGFRLESYGADGAAAVLMLFALSAQSQLVLALLALASLVRYRAMVPLVYLLLAVDQGGRRILVQLYDVQRASAASYIGFALLAILVAGLALSLFGSSRHGQGSNGG